MNNRVLCGVLFGDKSRGRKLIVLLHYKFISKNVLTPVMFFSYSFLKVILLQEFSDCGYSLYAFTMHHLFVQGYVTIIGKCCMFYCEDYLPLFFMHDQFCPSSLLGCQFQFLFFLFQHLRCKH